MTQSSMYNLFYNFIIDIEKKWHNLLCITFPIILSNIDREKMTQSSMYNLFYNFIKYR